MAKSPTQYRVRTIDDDAPIEPMWGANVVLLICSGVVAGMILATGDFEAARWFDNAWFHLGLLATIIICWLVGLAVLRRQHRRRMQLGVLLSVLAHLGLLLFTQHVYLTIIAKQTGEQRPSEPVDDPRRRLPDYQSRTDAQPLVANPLEQPANTPTPKLTPQPPEPAEQPTLPQPQPQPDAESTPTVPLPTPLELARREVAPPRLSEQTASEPLDRRMVDRQQPAEPIATEALAPTAESRPMPEAAATPLARQTADEPLPAPTAERAAVQPAPAIPQQLERRPSDPQTSSTPQTALARRPREQAAPSPAAESVALAPRSESQPDRRPAPEASPAAQTARAADSATVTLAGRSLPTPVASLPQPTNQPVRRSADSAAPAQAADAALPTAQRQMAAAGAAPQVAVELAAGGEPAGAAQPELAPSIAATSRDAHRGRRGQQALPITAGQTGPQATAGGEGLIASSSIGTARRTGVTPGVGDAAGRTLPQLTRSGSRGAGDGLATVEAQTSGSAVQTAATGSQANSGSESSLPGSSGTDIARQSARGGPAGYAAASADQASSVSGLPGHLSGGSGDRGEPRRGDGAADGSGPSIATAAMPTGGLPRSGKAIGHTGLPTTTAELAESGGSSNGTTADGAGQGRGAERALPGGGLARRSEAGLAPTGSAAAEAGGLPRRLPGEPGIASPRARRDGLTLAPTEARLIPKSAGGLPALDTRVEDAPAEAFRQRDPDGRGKLADDRGGSAASERAVEMGLAFLARHQNRRGSWSLHDFSQGRAGYENSGPGNMRSDTAATGLALLSFLGAGYTHREGKYRPVVGAGLDYLVAGQKPDGDLFVPQDERSNRNVWLYSHGIAAIALCEAYGMTRDSTLRGPAQRSLDFIVAAQHPQQGGWRYLPRSGSDTSVSGWQLMALKSGELAGLRIPDHSYQLVGHWLDGCRATGSAAQYVYLPGSSIAHQRQASRVMTAEALLMRQYLGWGHDHPELQAGARLLNLQLPSMGTHDRQQRDAYYWYYATQMLFQMQGEAWQAWNDALHPLLVDSQVAAGPLAGSWDPLAPVADRWGAEGGRIYVTCLHLLMLEVYYRHLPLYGEWAGGDQAD